MTEDKYLEAMQKLASANIKLKIAMKLLREARPLSTGDAAERWLMQLEGLEEEINND